MKTILITLSLVALSLGVSAQQKEERGERNEGYHQVYRQRVMVVPSFGFGYGYPYFGNPYYGNPYGYGIPYYGNRRMPYKLSLQIQSVKLDYKNKIREARKDKSLSPSQRREEIRNLKAERNQAIINAQSNFSRSGRMNNQNRDNGNSSSGG
jgi:hypothetical protein